MIHDQFFTPETLIEYISQRNLVINKYFNINCESVSSLCAFRRTKFVKRG